MTETSRTKRIFAGVNAITVVILTIAIAIVLNAVVSQVPMTWDLTDGKIYTLSDASIEVVSNLDEPIVVKAFVSPDMPPPFHTLSQQLNDLLSDYASKSNGKMTFQIYNPGPDDAEAEEAAKGFGIEKVGIGQQTEDEVSLRAVYKGIAFVKGDQTEVIKDLQTTGSPELDNFEYEFTKALMNLTNAEPLRVGFVSGFGGPPSNPQFVQGVAPIFESLFGKLIEVKAVDLSPADAAVPDEIDALVVLNAEAKFSDRAKFAIDQFLQRGGSLGWFQSAAGVDRQLQQQLMQQMGRNARIPDIRKPIDTGLNELVAHYGLELRSDVVLDRENALALGFSMTQYGLQRVSHPATFLIQDIDRSLPFTRNMPAMAIPAPSSIVVRPSVKENDELEAFEILKTSEVSIRRDSPPTSMNYQEFLEPQKGEQPGPFIVSAALQGKVPSYYKDNKLPDGVTEDQLVKDSSATSRILVVGSGEFFQPKPDVGFNQQLAGMGGQFLVSSIEWLVQDNKLTQIRGKKMPSLIGEVPKKQQNMIKWVNIQMVPALFALIGIIVIRIRRYRRENFEL